MTQTPLMVANIPFLLLYVVMLLLPGMLLTDIFKLKNTPSLFIIPLSIGIWIISLALSRFYGSDTKILAIIYFGIIAILSGIWFLSPINRSFSLRVTGWITHTKENYLTITALTGFVAYAMYVGPYLEVPADNLWHLSVVQDIWQQMNSGELSSEIPWYAGLFSPQRGYYWHSLYAFAAWLTVDSLLPTYNTVWVINSTSLAVGVYLFAGYLFRSVFAHEAVQFAALLSALFFVVYFGISEFGYIRYYSFAPAGLGLLSYFSFIVLFRDVLYCSENWLRNLLFSGILILLSAMWHTQEALFMIVMAYGLLVHRVWHTYKNDRSKYFSFFAFCKQYRFLLTLFAVAVITYLVVHGYLYTNKIRNSPFTYGRLIAVDAILPFIKNLYILNPINGFYQVVTIWGVAVYIFWFFHRARYRLTGYITVGMWIPLFTVFNPVYTDLFLRLENSNVLWRILFLTPLPFVAAYLLVDKYQAIKCLSNSRILSIGNSLKFTFMAIVFTAFLWPVNTRFLAATYSKFPMLSRVAPQADYRNWSDMLDQLTQYPGKEVLTDQVTGYLVNAHSQAHYSGLKFYGTNAFSTRKLTYNAGEFQKYAGSLLIINLRDGSPSEIGRLGRHWPESVRKMQQWYSPEFLQFIKTCSGLTTLLWKKNLVSIYRIRNRFTCDQTVTQLRYDYPE